MQAIDSNRVIGIRIKNNGNDFQIAQGEINSDKRYKVMTFSSKEDLDKFIAKLNLLRRFIDESEQAQGE